MDDSVNHLAQLPRAYPGIVLVDTIGHLPHKTNWVRATFGTCNFSFILQGSGYYHRADQQYRVQSPCVIMQWPGEPLVYGPEESAGWWEEWYFIIPARQAKALLQVGFRRHDRPVWPIGNPVTVRERIEDLQSLLNNTHREGTADRIDRLVESMILESLLGSRVPEESPSAAAVRKIRAQAKRDFVKPFDFVDLARRQGLSQETFRRHWRQQVKLSPLRYLTRLRLREACRLLVETSHPIGEIAATVGFADALYFSRQFRREHGETATEYRRRHQESLRLSRKH